MALSKDTKGELATLAVNHPSLLSFLDKLETEATEIWEKVHAESVSGSQPGTKEAEEKDAELDGPPAA